MLNNSKYYKKITNLSLKNLVLDNNNIFGNNIYYYNVYLCPHFYNSFFDIFKNCGFVEVHKERI